MVSSVVYIYWTILYGQRIDAMVRYAPYTQSQNNIENRITQGFVAGVRFLNFFFLLNFMFFARRSVQSRSLQRTIFGLRPMFKQLLINGNAVKKKTISFVSNGVKYSNHMHKL